MHEGSGLVKPPSARGVAPATCAAAAGIYSTALGQTGEPTSCWTFRIGFRRETDGAHKVELTDYHYAGQARWLTP